MPKLFVLESFTAAKVSGTEKVWRRGGGSRFSVENFLSLSVEILRGGILYCCITSGYRKSLDKRGGGRGFQDYQSKIFCLTVPKISVGEPFSVSLISGVEEFYTSEGYITIFGFLSNFFVSQCRNLSQVNPSVLCFRNLAVAKKFR